MSRADAVESPPASVGGGPRQFARDCVFALALCAVLMTVVATSSAGYWLGGTGVLLVSVLVVRRSRAPWSYFGLTLAGAKVALRRALGSTLLLSACVLGALFWLRARGALGEDTPLLRPSFDLELSCYVLVAAPAQEWLFRGVAQGAARLLLGARRRGLVVGVGAALYALGHLPWGLGVALPMVVPGIVWGLEFERDRTLLGVGVSHALVGYLFVGVTPLWSLLTAGVR